MSQLEKATLQAVSSDASATPIGDPIPVQFNPSSMRLEIKNSTEGGESRGRQVRQYTGTSSTTLSLDLIFDTADEGTTDAPVSVRTKTAALEQFIYPTTQNGNKQSPPKLRFQWGDLILEGVVDGLNMDLDHFAANGVPLRAKVSFSFKQQDPKFEFLTSGPGANTGGSPPGAGSPGSSGPGGTGGGGPANRADQAIGGESAADFAARMGLPPEAWRGLDFSASAGGSLSLDAGVQIGFNANLSASAGLGATAGVSAGAAAPVATSFGLDSSAGAAAGGQAQGFALAAAGGVTAAIEAVKSATAQSAAAGARQAFGAAPVVAQTQAPPRPAMPDQPRTPLTVSGMPTPSQQAAAPTAPAPPSSDPRATSFGIGVPLRPTLGSAAQQRASLLRGGASPSVSTLPVTTDPTVPGWVALPAVDSGKTPSVTAGGAPIGPCGCGCGGA